jgi:hypothetical protein
MSESDLYVNQYHENPEALALEQRDVKAGMSISEWRRLPWYVRLWYLVVSAW